MPEISVITPVFNSEKTITRCINSVLTQLYTDIELIVIDDGSNDRSGVIVDGFACSDTRVRVFHTENRGVSAARNLGIRNARGRYLFFLDSDDVINEQTLQEYYYASENGKYDVVIGRLTVLTNDIVTNVIGIPYPVNAGDEIWDLICQDTGPFGYAGGKMIRTSLIVNNEIMFNESMKCQEDLDFFLTAYSCCHYFRLIPYSGYYYYYTESARKMPVCDLVANQLKTLTNALGATNVAAESLNKLYARVQQMVFSALYHSAGTEQFNSVVQELSGLEQLISLLSTTKARGEHQRVLSWFVKGRIRQIEYYFIVRNTIRDYIRILQGRLNNG